MLKINLDKYNLNVFNEFDKVWPILTAGDKVNGFNSMTVSWGGIGILWGKKVGFVFVRKSRYTYEFTEKSDSLTLSFLPENYHNELALMGKLSGRDVDKLKETNLHLTYDPDYDGAYITEAHHVFKMKKLYQVELPVDNLPKDIIDKYYPEPIDEHTLYVCEIKQYLEKRD